MRVLLLLLALAGTSYAACDPALKATITPRIKLQKPSTKMCDWDVPIQQSFDLLDASVGMTTLSQSWAMPQTFSQIKILSGTLGPNTVLQGDVSGTGVWTDQPSVRSLAVSDSVTIAGKPVTSGPTPHRLGGIYFDLGAGSLTTADEWPLRLDPYPATITRVECEAYTGTSFTIKLCAGEDTGDDTCTTDIISAPLVCTTGGAFTTSIASAAVAPRDKVTIVITAVSGSVTKGEVY